MPYPVRLIGDTDAIVVGGRTYKNGEVIRDLPDQTRVSLQQAGVRFAAVHEDDPPEEPAPTDVAVQLPPDQVAVNREIAEQRATPAKAASRKGAE